MNDFNLTVFEFLRNYFFLSFFIPAVIILLGIVFDQLSRSENPKGTAIALSISSFLIIVATSMTLTLNVPAYTCFTTVDNFIGYAKSPQYKEDLIKKLNNEKKSLEVAKKFNAKNLPQLEKYVAQIEKDIIAADIAIKQASTPETHEYMVLAKIDKGYTVLQEDGNVITDYKFTLKKYAAQHDINFTSCSMEITQSATKKGFLAKTEGLYEH